MKGRLLSTLRWIRQRCNGQRLLQVRRYLQSSPARWRLTRWCLGCGAAWAAMALAAWLLVYAQDYPQERFSVRDSASLTIVDRTGRQLWQAGASGGEQRSWVAISDVAPVFLQAALASEDHRFYEHSGVDVYAALRAVGLNLRAGRLGYGASTISMQTVRLLQPELNTRSIWGKLKQALYALRLERALGKQEILEQYVNRAYFGNGAFGIEAAAQLYFGTGAAVLSPAQAAFLAALPRAPRAYDPYQQRARAQVRQRHILERMQELGWLSAASASVARDAALQLKRERKSAHAPHFVDHLISSLPSEQIRGARLVSTLDLRLQEQVEVAVERHLQTVGGRDVTQAGVIVLDNRTGDILAMLGSRNYFDVPGHGAVNVTTIRRRPGSTLKPFVYALALERGDSPATLAYDVILPGEAKETYTADVRQHGFARYREALAGSYNLAAVHTLEKVGVRALLERLRLAGLSTLTEPDSSYGVDLAIGDAEVELLEYAAAFAAFGNHGRAITPRSVLRLQWPLGASGELSNDALRSWLTPVAGKPIFSPSIAYLIFDILADPDARRPMFGRSAPMELPYPVALKTGTTRGYTDNLALGTTREFTVGAWAGNFDGSAMQGVMAMQGAAPLVRAAFVALAATYGEPSAPERPSELVQRSVCSVSGERPGAHCPGRKLEWFTPASAQRWEQASVCTFHTEHAGRQGVAFPKELGHWARAYGLRDLQAEREREPHAAGPLRIVYPEPGSRFRIDPHRPLEHQLPPLRVLPAGAAVQFSLDGVAVRDFRPTPGPHVLRAQWGEQRAEVEIHYEP